MEMYKSFSEAAINNDTFNPCDADIPAASLLYCSLLELADGDAVFSSNTSISSAGSVVTSLASVVISVGCEAGRCALHGRLSERSDTRNPSQLLWECADLVEAEEGSKTDCAHSKVPVEGDEPLPRSDI